MAMVDKKQAPISEEQTKFQYRVVPRYSAWNEGNKIILRIALPGVSKKDIEMKCLKDYFFLKAKRDNILYTLELDLNSDIKTNAVKSEYTEGLLKVEFERSDPLENAYIVPIK